MPVGVIVNCFAVVIGGLLGAKFGSLLSEDLRNKLNLIFGLCSMCIGITSVILMKNMPAVVLSVIAGTIIGLLLHLEKRIEHAGVKMSKLFPDGGQVRDKNLLVTAIVLFCASGTGIYGSIVSGMEGDHSILLAKSILDLFTAMIFACTLGLSVSAIAVPQTVIFLILFFCARLIFPLTTPSMVNDFKACGGFIMLATGFRITKIRDFPIADMIHAMILVWPLSALWTHFIG